MAKRIDDHSFWAGGKSKGSVFPEGVHTKEYRSCEGAGEVGSYQDSTEAIYRTQMEGERKASKHKMKEGYRY